MFLENKIILLISPQRWQNNYISKHHFAIELSKKNKIYFLEPPDNQQTKKIIIKNAPNFKKINIITYKPFFPINIRFRFRKLFDFLMKKQIERLTKSLPESLTVVWCFDPNLYFNLNWFKAKYNIYHPVDILQYDYQKRPAETANLVLSVSKNILDFVNVNRKSHFINHGLCRAFENIAVKNLKEIQNTLCKKSNNKSIKVGYSGNLLIPSLDDSLLLKLVEQFSSINFHFWGTENNVDMHSIPQEKQILINKLQSLSNVYLHGIVTPEILADELNKMDILLILYKTVPNLYDGSNSHKILEYLSTGKVILSSLIIDAYSNHKYLIISDKNFNDIFSIVINNIKKYNSPKLKEKRINFSLKNTYNNRLIDINNLINSNLQ